MHLDLSVGRDDESGLLVVEPVVDGGPVLPEPLRGVDPDWVLPPLSGALLPSGTGRPAMVGTCCTPGCGSFSVQVRRDGQRVLWEPDPHAADRTLAGVLDFPLLAYLDAVDGAAADPLLHERGRRLARAAVLAVRRRPPEHGDGPGEASLPMAWQTGQGEVNVSHRGRLHAVPLSDLPGSDPEAVDALTVLLLNPDRLPPAPP